MQHLAPARTLDSMNAQNQADPNKYGIIHAARIDFANEYAAAYTARAGKPGQDSTPSAYDYAMRHAPVIARELIQRPGDIETAMMQAGTMGIEDAMIDYPRSQPIAQAN